MSVVIDVLRVPKLVYPTSHCIVHRRKSEAQGKYAHQAVLICLTTLSTSSEHCLLRPARVQSIRLPELLLAVTEAANSKLSRSFSKCPSLSPFLEIENES